MDYGEKHAREGIIQDHGRSASPLVRREYRELRLRRTWRARSLTARDKSNQDPSAFADLLIEKLMETTVRDTVESQTRRIFRLVKRGNRSLSKEWKVLQKKVFLGEKSVEEQRPALKNNASLWEFVRAAV